jgi:hypothetical protein
MRVRKRRSARPRKAERSETPSPILEAHAERSRASVNNSAFDTAARKHTGECPQCLRPGKLTVEPRQQLGYAPWRVWCRTASCCDLSPGEWLREVAKTVNAPSGSHLLEEPLRYLSDYLEAETRTDREPEQIPSLASIHGRASRLLTTHDAFDYLTDKRGLTEDTITDHMIGWDGSAFTFPIHDSQGEVVNLVRRPWPDTPDGRKYITLRGRNRHNGGVELYPRPLPSGSWLLCEGLLDALLGRQEGLNAVTSTHGVDTFLDEWLPLVRGRRVAIAYDVGAEPIMHRRVAQLRAAGAEAWPVELSQVLRNGKDLSDALMGGWTAEALIEFINSERGSRRRRQAA